MGDVFTLEFLANFLFKFIILILFVLTFTYIQKLENIGCACSVHPYRDFIRTFSIIASVYFGIVMFAAPKIINKSLGTELTVLYNLLDFIFLSMTLVYFYCCIEYVRYLVNEKCKCSEDLRRDIILWYSIVEMFLLLLVVMVALIIPVIGSTSISAIDGVTKMRSGLKSTLLNPIGSVRESPTKIKKVINDTSGVFKNASKSIISSLKKRVR